MKFGKILGGTGTLVGMYTGGIREVEGDNGKTVTEYSFVGGLLVGAGLSLVGSVIGNGIDNIVEGIKGE